MHSQCSYDSDGQNVTIQKQQIVNKSVSTTDIIVNVLMFLNGPGEFSPLRLWWKETCLGLYSKIIKIIKYLTLTVQYKTVLASSLFFLSCHHVTEWVKTRQERVDLITGREKTVRKWGWEVEWVNKVEAAIHPAFSLSEDSQKTQPPFETTFN